MPPRPPASRRAGRAPRSGAAVPPHAAIHPTAPGDGRRADLLWALGYEYYLTDQVEDALDAGQEALEIWAASGDSVRVGDAHRWLSRLHWFAGRNDLAERHGGPRGARRSQGSGTVELAMAYSNLAQLRMLSSDVHGTRLWGRRAMAALDELPDGRNGTRSGCTR